MAIVRDLVGYGRPRPDIVWPNGARVAVSLVLNFEEGAELAVEQADTETEKFGEVVSVQPSGVRDLVQEQVFNFGMRVGLWRFLDAFERHATPVTLMMCGRAVERVPELAHEAVSRGHEPAVHGWRWLANSRFQDRDIEREDIVRALRQSDSCAAAGRAPGHAISCPSSAFSTTPTPLMTSCRIGIARPGRNQSSCSPTDLIPTT
jgi:peptidoglycan/xylan/chitin deacetylase (PgdA/CDA1 family)